MGLNGGCQLVPGLPQPDHSLACAEDKSLVSYHEPTGYRRIPITTCEGGKEFDKASDEHPCPGHDKDFDDKQKGLGGFWLFIVAFVLPVALASVVGYWVYNHWDGKLGSIRLGGGSSGSSSDAFDSDRPWIKYPIAVIAGGAAVLSAVPLLLRSLWRSTKGLFKGKGDSRYTSRGDFARGGRYARVDPDEDELLGDDDDDEV